MSADAAPAAATTPSIAIPPAPNTAPTATGAGPRQSLLASMVAPVEPARPAFALDPATATQNPSQGGTDVPSGGVSSASFHDHTTPADTKTNNASGSGAGKPKQGMIRALVLAAAARWAKGGGTANKRLDMHKARAQADQVKETRQVTVNRSPGTGGGAGSGKESGAGGGRGSKGSGAGSAGGSASGTGGKSLDRKSSGGGTKNSGSTGPKNNTSPTKGSKNPSAPDKGGNTRGPSGSSGSSGRGSTGGTGAGGTGGGKNTGGGRTDSSANPKPAKTKDTPANTPKHTAPAPKGSGKTGTSGGTAAGGAKGSTGSAGKPGKDGKTAPAPTTPKGPSADGGTNTKHAPAGPRIPKQTTTNDKKTTGNDKKTTGKDTGDTAKNTKPKPDLTKDQKPKDPATKTSDTPNKPDPASKTPGGEKQTTDEAATADASGTPLATQPARETGYRDGTRAGKAAAHVRAYRDGVKDGWADSLAAADHEKALLDEAHADRKHSRDETRESEQPVATTTASSADHHTTTPDGPQPIQVTGIDAKNLHLGDGATRNTISRGEVRSLKQYERRLGERLTTLQRTAENAKKFQAHAEGQAQQAQTLLEQAKGVKGGDKLVSKLSRVAEDAKEQVFEAKQIHRTAVRAADTCQALLANVATRYGGMYQAVVDSPETIPAELAYYQGA